MTPTKDLKKEIAKISDKDRGSILKAVRKRFHGGAIWLSQRKSSRDYYMINLAFDKGRQESEREIAELKRKARLLDSMHAFAKNKDTGKVTDLYQDFIDYCLQWSKECDESALAVIHENVAKLKSEKAELLKENERLNMGLRVADDMVGKADRLIKMTMFEKFGNDRTFDKIQRAFGKSYNFSGDEYWRPEQKEFQDLKRDVLELLKPKEKVK
jgi:hypothetical protein